jgi:DnaJ-class molecular chaperone
MADYYKVLGVPKSATADQIRKAYKKIARENHPDAKPGDAAAGERFKQAAEAYEVLGDADTRKQYDQFGDAYKYAKAGGGPAGGGPFPGGGFRGGSGPIDLGDIFGGQVDLGDLFGGAFGGQFGGGGGRSTSRPRRGSDVRSEVQIPFDVAASGGSYDLALQRNGKVERLTVKIPPGVREGSVIRLAGEGEPGDGSPGDLLVTVRIAPHPWFRREGNDLLLDVPVTVTEAALGAKVDVPTLNEGRVTLTIPAGTSSGTRIRMRGMGIPDTKTKTTGDQFVIVRIVVPRQLSDEASRLLREFEGAAPLSPRASLWPT